MENFRKLAELSTQTKTGTTFLIQGAPGVGKTALLAECAKQAKRKGWRVAEIDTPDLCDPDKLRYSLGSEEMKLEDTTLAWRDSKIYRGRVTTQSNPRDSDSTAPTMRGCSTIDPR